MDNFEFFGNTAKAQEFVDSTKNSKFLFSFVLSYTETSEIPGITFAGADKESIKYTPPADAEYLYYGFCKTIDKIPMTPDGKPTPALLTKTALENSSIPHIVINAGSKILPQLPFIQTGLSYGLNISSASAMSESQVIRAIDFGRIVGRTLATMNDCLIIGESVPGGTTTALATLRGLGFKCKVSSSIPNNPVELKNTIVDQALKRIDTENPYKIVAEVGDPMIPFVGGMLSSASQISKVLLAGGTQMSAVLALASKIGFNENNTTIGTTSYIVNDSSANFVEQIKQISDVGGIAVDPHLEQSKFSGLRAFSEGFAKEGVGAGGSIIASMIKSGIDSNRFCALAEKEYERLFTSQ
ncbi:MAG: TIGR00303 family protein [Nitrosopumilaceae archaeon]|nr:TIGR00303 family protein [Nitrosopumilaceae archaeon]